MRILTLLLVFAPLPLSAGEGTAPERLAPRTSLFYFRWEGYTPHKAAYEASAAGAMLNDRYGQWLAEVGRHLEKTALDGLLGANPILDGRSPGDVLVREKKRQQFLAVKTILRDHGVMLCADVQSNPLMGLLAKRFDLPDGFGFEVRMVVPGAARHRELFETVLTSLANINQPAAKIAIEPTTATVAGRSVTSWLPEKIPLQLWVEGDDCVARFGTAPFEKVVAALEADCEGLAGTARYRRLVKEAPFTVTTRLMLDPARLLALSASIGGSSSGTSSIVKGVFGGLEKVDYVGGFDGKLSRYHVDFAAKDSSTNLASAFIPRPIRLDELPALPPRASRWAAVRIDPLKFEDWLMALSGDAKEFRSVVKDLIKFDIRRDLLPHMGDTLISFVDEDEGKVFNFSIGHTFMVKVKDDAAARKAVKSMAGGIGSAFKLKPVTENDAGRPVTTIQAGGDLGQFGIGVSFAVYKGWLVISASANAVRSTLDRMDGVNPAWKPDLETRKKLEAAGADSFGVQWSDPGQTLRRGADLAFFGAQLLGQNPNNKPLPMGLNNLPTIASVEKHLFPNVTIYRRNGNTVRLDARDSFSLPMEGANLESLVGLGLILR